MEASSSHNVTELLLAWEAGDEKAFDLLVALVYEELHRMAVRHMRGEQQWHTLQPTALVNEAYCKLVDLKSVRWQNRAQFFGIAAKIMRRILIDHAKTRLRAKRGGDVQKVPFDERRVASEERAAELISIDRALTEMAKHDPLKSRIVEMKFFGGLGNEEIAEIEKVSKRTIEREWRKARAWLYNAIRS